MERKRLSNLKRKNQNAKNQYGRGATLYKTTNRSHKNTNKDLDATLGSAQKEKPGQSDLSAMI